MLDGAKMILSQLGGKRFILMTGAKNFIGKTDPIGIGFKIPKSKDGINYIGIDLDAGTDTYTMTFMRSGSKYTIEVVKKIEGVYCDQLQSVFTRVTGLYTKL